MNNTIKYRISVIMAVYNCANTLPEALDSLLSQTYQNFKVIICDDASTDNTYEIAKKYVDLYPEKFMLIKNEINKKLAASLNKCLEHVDTEYVARMDGDDISLPTRFQKQINFLDQHPEYALVSNPMVYFDEEGDFKIGKAHGAVNKYNFIKGSPFCHATTMIRKESLDSVNGYSIEYDRCQDYELWFRLYAKGYIGYNLQEPLYKMRDDRHAVSRRKFKYRIVEAKIRLKGYKLLDLPFYSNFYVLKPILIGLLPLPLYNFLHKKF